MPRLENIERFKEILYALGSEPQVNAQRSEAREEDVPTEESADEQGGADFGLDAAGASGEGLPALGLDDLLGEGHEGASPTDEAGETPAPEPDESEQLFDTESGGAEGLGELDIGDLLGETVEQESSSAETPAEDLGLANGFFMPDLGLEKQEDSAPEAPEAPEAPGAAEAEPGEEPAPSDQGFAAFPEGESAEGDETEADAEAPPGGEAASFDPFAVDFGSLDATEAPAEQSGGGLEAGTEEAPLDDGSFGLPEVGAEAAGLEDGAAEEEGPPSAEAGLEEQPPEMESFDTSGLGAEEASGTADDSVPGGQTGLEASIDELADGFSLEGLSDGLTTERASGEGPETPEPAPASEGGETSEPAETGEAAEFSMEDRAFRAFQRNLAILPRNLKIAIETLIGEQGYTGEGLPLLLDMIARGASPREIAAHYNKISGRSIKIPARFERQTGEAFEQAQRSPAYLFKKNVLPILRTIVLVGGLLGVLALGGYQLVYIPLHARSLYRAGYSALERGRYDESVRSFDKATEVQQVKSWYYRYAEGYTRQKEYRLADGVYAKLELFFKYDKKELLDRARLKSQKLSEFSEADKLLEVIRGKDFHDYAALLAQGNNYLAWAAETPAKAAGKGERTRADLLEEARRSFAHLLERHGYQNEILFGMMRYFVRADRLDEVQDLRASLEADLELKPDPAVYAEVGGYLLDKEDIEGARTVLRKADAVGSELPEVDYQLARFYRLTDDPNEEGKALKNVLLSFSKGEVERTPERISMAIDTHRRYGELLFREKRYLDATREFQTAIAAIEKEQAAGIVGRRPDFGLAYQGLGDVDYYVDGDYAAALPLYELARRNGVADPNLDYRIGYIHYADGEYARAVAELVPVQEKLPQNWNVLFALATSLHQRGDYFAAEGYYRRLVDKLTDKRNGISDLRPEVNPDHLKLVNLLTKAHNNLGVTYYLQGKMRGSRGRELSQALVEITQAAQYLDILARDPETLERSEARNLAYLNANGIQHPTTRFQPTIYDRLPKDTAAERF